ncbi:SDR family NAD(P)-dependent oxidoreductase [Pseudonocardia acaciae]|uniref:SDR family NAD(P)-dependent oxidoreductase n=1 Tax=Pseudonocardia acaciae TaxID=551276 RepID=UPI00048AA475|nr:SDR family NAD(P)-dependent oxidoreductase [Pseudonocardia acaciae]
MLDSSSSSRVAVVTGAAGDLGRLLAARLAESGWSVVLHADTAEDAEAAAEKLVKDGAEPLRLHTAAADLTRLAEVRRLAGELAGRHPALGLLVHAAHAGPAERRLLTPDGHERTFAVDYLAPFVLTDGLRGCLTAGNGRVVSLSSVLHRGAGIAWADPTRAKGYTPLAAYGQATLAVTMFTRSLAASGISAICVDAGSDDPQIARMRRWDRTPAEHASDIVTQLCPPALVRDGAFYLGLLPDNAAASVDDPGALRRLRRLTEKLVEPR